MYYESHQISPYDVLPLCVCVCMCVCVHAWMDGWMDVRTKGISALNF